MFELEGGAFIRDVGSSARRYWAQLGHWPGPAVS
jgi:hypothetical protein